MEHARWTRDSYAPNIVQMADGPPNDRSLFVFIVTPIWQGDQRLLKLLEPVHTGVEAFYHP